MRQVSTLQSADQLSCKSVQPVPARVEDPISPVRQSSSGGAANNLYPFPRCPKPARESRQSKLTVLPVLPVRISTVGGEHEQQQHFA